MLDFFKDEGFSAEIVKLLFWLLDNLTLANFP